jgi:hypothetical protein
MKINKKDLHRIISETLDYYLTSNYLTATDQDRRELVSEEYHRLITETLSISEQVETVANKIFQLIKQNPNIKEVQNIGFIGHAMLNLKQHDYNNIQDYNTFLDECTYDSDLKIRFDDSKRIYGIIFEIEYSTLNGEIIDGKLLDVLYHEVEHAYQDYCKCFKGMGTRTPPKHFLYDFAISHMNDNDNYFISVLSRILYIANWGEQDAYVNQLYSELKQNKLINDNNLEQYYRKTEACKLLNYLLKWKKEVPTWDEDHLEYIYMQKFLEAYNITFNKNQMVKLIEKIIRRFSIKIQQVIKNFKKGRNITEVNFFARKPYIKLTY